jgi:hypothetical protein
MEARVAFQCRALGIHSSGAKEQKKPSHLSSTRESDIDGVFEEDLVSGGGTRPHVIQGIRPCKAAVSGCTHPMQGAYVALAFLTKQCHLGLLSRDACKANCLRLGQRCLCGIACCSAAACEADRSGDRGVNGTRRESIADRAPCHLALISAAR